MVINLPAGTHVDVLECQAAKWCRVSRFSHAGWVPEANLRTRLYANGLPLHEAGRLAKGEAGLPAGTTTASAGGTAPGGVSPTNAGSGDDSPSLSAQPKTAAGYGTDGGGGGKTLLGPSSEPQINASPAQIHAIGAGISGT